MESLGDRPLAALLDELAARRPAPGGGSAAAWACALAAALVEMSAAFAPDEPSGPGEAPALMAAIRERAAELRAHALALADRELRSYAPVLEALGLPADAPDRRERMAAALSGAAETPLEIARAAAEVAELAAEAAAGGSEHLRGDAAAGALLAEAACRAAGRLVALNLAGRPSDPRHGEVAELARRGKVVRADALNW